MSRLATIDGVDDYVHGTECTRGANGPLTWIDDLSAVVHHIVI
jgi:hypothetical protein